MKKLIFILIFPLCCQAQFLDHQFMGISTGVDLRNATIGGTVNERAYNGTYNLLFRSGGFNLQASYETFKEIEFSAIEVSAGHVFNQGNNFQFPLMAGVAIINRPVTWMPQQYHAGLSLTVSAEYHFNNTWFVFLSLENWYRGDLKKNVQSGRGGLGIKLFNN